MHGTTTARLRFCPGITCSGPREFPLTIINRIIEIFVSSASLEHKLNLFLASQRISARFYACARYHLLTQDERVFHVLCSQQVDSIIRAAIDCQETGEALSTHTLSFTIEAGNEAMLDSMLKFSRALHDPTIAFGLPQLVQLQVEYRNTSYHSILLEAHIPSLPPSIQELSLVFSYTDPAIAKRMRQEYRQYQSICPSDPLPIHPYESGSESYRNCHLQRLILRNVPHAFMSRFVAVNFPFLSPFANYTYRSPPTSFWDKARSTMRSIFSGNGFKARVTRNFCLDNSCITMAREKSTVLEIPSYLL